MNDLTRFMIRNAVPWLCLPALAACAGPQATVPPHPPSGSVAPQPPAAPEAVAEPQVPPPAEELASFSLVRDQPAIAHATAELAAAPPASRPAALMRRARDSFSDAGKLLTGIGGSFVITSRPTELTLFLAYCELSLRDLREVLVVYPNSPEAPEAMYTVGRINDYPNLNQFGEALEAYHLTIERYPGTPWATQAGERIRVIEEFGGKVVGSPHGESAPPPVPAR